MNRENEAHREISSAERFDRKDTVLSLRSALWFLFIDGEMLGGIRDHKTESAFNEFGLTSEANKHPARVSLDQSVEIIAS